MATQDQKYQIDCDGYRKNVGLIVCNDNCQVLWSRRVRHDGWQFPQGGIEPCESVEAAAFRELYEEVGLLPTDVKLLGCTNKWLRYDVPYAPQTHHYHRARNFRGQKQRWFMFKLISHENRVRLDLSDNPEFDHWQWIDYWRPVKQIVEFKRAVYQRALTELEPLLFSN